MGCVANSMGLDLPPVWLLSRDLRSLLLVLEFKSMTILTLLSMATEMEQYSLCFMHPLVALVKSLLRSNHLSQWLMAKLSLSHSLHLLDKILSRTACSFLPSILRSLNKSWIQLSEAFPQDAF